jgi:thioredoxin reductase
MKDHAPDCNVVVIGAGPCGLSAATYLGAAGI